MISTFEKYCAEHMKDDVTFQYTAPVYWKLLCSPHKVIKERFKDNGKDMGEYELYLFTGDDVAEKKVLEMREAGMKIREDAAFRIPMNFTGIFIATGAGAKSLEPEDNISSFLRKCENQAHDDWAADEYREKKDYVRQGIARLYWSVYLTYDEGNENPYEYTELLFTKQDVLVNIGERSYGRNRTIALAAMKELKKHPDLSREDTRLFFAKLNQAGAITVLDFLDEDQATQLCKNLMDEVFAIPELQDGCSFMLYDNITGKAYSDTLKLLNGKAVKTVKRKLLPGMQEQIIDTSPKTLRGKREGSKVTIDDKKYVIKDIQ